LISVNRSLASHYGNISNPSADDSWSYRATGSVPTGLLCARPDGVEFTARQFERPGR